MSSQAVHPIEYSTPCTPDSAMTSAELLRGQIGDMHHHAHGLELEEVVERSLLRLARRSCILEPGGGVEGPVGHLDRVVRVGRHVAQGAQGVARLEDAGVDDAVAAVGLRIQREGDRAVGAAAYPLVMPAASTIGSVAPRSDRSR